MMNITPDMARRELARRELARRELNRRQSQEQSSNEIQQSNNIPKFLQGNDFLTKHIARPISEGIQGFSNVPIDLANLAIKGGNLLASKNAPVAPEIPRFNFFPEDLNTLTGSLAFPMGKAATALAPVAGKVINALSPGKASAQFLNKLSSGALNSESNLLNITKKISEVGTQKQNEALSHADNVRDIIGKTKLTEIPKELIPKSLKNVTKKLNYLSKDNRQNIKNYNSSLKKLHSNFIKDTTFNNAHLLESQLGAQIEKLKSTKDAYSGFVSDSLINSREAIRKDMNHLVSKQGPEVKKEWSLFKKKYHEEYGPYASTNALRKIRDNDLAAKPSFARSLFAFPKKDALKILSDLGPKERNAILYNELTNVKPKDAESLLENLDQLGKSKGYSHLITPEINAFKEDLRKQVRNKNVLTLGVPSNLKKINKFLQRK